MLPMLISTMLMLMMSLISVAFVTLFERKILGIMQMRIGPNKTFIMGYFQPFSDAIKLYLKEKNLPTHSSKTLFLFCPFISLFIAMNIWMCMPFYKPMIQFNSSFLIFLSILGLGVYPILMSGWASNSNYSLLGSMRALAQTISYEVSLIFILFTNSFMACTIKIQHMSSMQKFFSFYMILISFLLWIISMVAELNRTPFDFAEGESELVSGFNTEYSGGVFAIIFMSEYMMILFFSFFTSNLYISMSPLFTNLFSFSMVMFTIMWLRVTLPRYRYDKLMMLSWKLILPISTTHLIFASMSLTMMKY
uniref:NADH dehydrogenase subunit 1 n=1 Tax=Ayyaria chaetophora TaxID=1291247 RepID=UPI0030E3A8F9